jgi:hypothetical protein
VTDDLSPYSGAIEEAARTTGKALDLLRDSARPIADAYGLLIGDQIQTARIRRLDALNRKTKEILKERHLSETAEVAEQIAIPLLEAAQREPRHEMQDIWARLLANAMDPSRRDDVRPEFIDTLKTFHPTDAIVLEWLGEHKAYGWQAATGVSETLNIRNSSAVVTFVKLMKENCVLGQGGQQFAISDFGEELLLACRP